MLVSLLYLLVKSKNLIYLCPLPTSNKAMPFRKQTYFDIFESSVSLLYL